ncbi:MAG: tetratricopeptide repeat protein [Bacteroidales bacterium]|nr:tetratricopeptide repeat protein [Bacteroidales bacterium]
MKRYITLTIAILTAFSAQGTSTAHLKANYAQMGDSAYRAGNYEEAAAIYEEVISEGFTSADLYYNLGNTHYRLGNHGPAILNYERALRLKPGMKDAQENLALANSKTVDRITELPRFFLVRWYENLCTHITPHSWRVVWLLLFALVSAAVATFLLTPSLAARKGSFAAIIAASVLLLLASATLLSSTRRYNAHSEAIVMQESMAVKGSPEQQSVDKLILHEGTKVTITESLAGWEKITLADGTTGWCETQNIERI